MIHLNPLTYKIVGLITFKTESPIHIGAGGIEARRNFLRLPSGEFLIPSSSWKGAFRSISEKMAKAMRCSGIEEIAVNFYRETQSGIRYRSEDKSFEEFVEDFAKRLKGEEGKWVKDDLGKLEKILEDLGYSQEEIKEVKERGKKAKDGLAYEMAESYLALYCPIGKLYGNGVLAGKLRFGDVIVKECRTHLRPGVGIDRKTITAKPGVLYFIQIIEDAELRLPLILDNPTPGELDSILLARTIDYIQELGLSIGGRKSTGLGRLKIEEDGGEFYLIRLRGDDKLAIGNPFKKAEKLTLSEFTRWLRGNS